MSTFTWAPMIDQIVPTVSPTFLMHKDESGLCQAHRVGIPEFPIIQFIKDNFEHGGVFLDCGAHMGVYSILLADHFDVVFAYEAQRRTYNQLCGNIFLNEKDNVHPQRIALGDKGSETHKSIYIVSEDGGGTTTIRPKDESKILSTEIVATCALDDLEYDAPVDLIKLDIEGAELDTLSGARNLIESNKPLILFESNPGRENYQNQLKIFGFLHERGYNINKVQEFDNMFIAACLE